MIPKSVHEERIRENADIEEPYEPHLIVGAIDHNPADGMILIDKKK